MHDLSGKVFKSEFRSGSKITEDNSDDDWAAAMANQAAVDVGFEDCAKKVTMKIKDTIFLSRVDDFISQDEVDTLLKGVCGPEEPETLQEWLNSTIIYRKDVIKTLERDLLESNTILRTLNEVLEKVENDKS